VDREEAGRSALSRLVTKIFRGSPELLLTQLVSQRQLRDDQIRRMRQLLDDSLGEGKE
jgi:BlaI family penicillinase repressor